MRVPAAEAGSGQAEPGQPQPGGAAAPPVRLGLPAVAIATAVAVLSLAGYATEVALTRHFHEVTWYDLNVYNDAGLLARHRPATLYSWQLKPGIKFTYTPFAALVFAAGSELSLRILHWLMTVASIAALPVTAWLVLRALGWRGRSRLAATLTVAAVALWTEPVVRALHLGQIELLLMLAIVWDICQDDRRWWKGAGIGVAAGIKMVPLIFIPYLVLCGKIRQAAVAAATVAITVLLGFAFLPRASAHWWLTGYFLHAGNVGDVGSLVNQSLLAVLARAMGGVNAATPAWLPLAAVTAVTGLAAGAALHRRGQPVAGWVTCAITGLLVSPISWDQHWVWIVPIMIVLADRAVRAAGAVRWIWWALAIAAAGVYADWPAHWAGPQAFVPYFGLISFFAGPHPVNEIYHLHGIQILSWNLFAAAGLVMLAVAVIAAVRQWRRAPDLPAR